jgi:hypothetical protein
MAISGSDNADREIAAETSAVSPADEPQNVQSYQTFSKSFYGDSTETPPRDSVTESAGGDLNGEEANGGSGPTIAVRRRDRIFAYIKTRDFWIVLVLGYTLNPSSLKRLDAVLCSPSFLK